MDVNPVVEQRKRERFFRWLDRPGGGGREGETERNGWRADEARVERCRKLTSNVEQ